MDCLARLPQTSQVERFHSLTLKYQLTLRTVAPNGMLYVKTGVRRGLLGRMLTELLDTRVMVKQSMKTHKHDKVRIDCLTFIWHLILRQMLQRILDARQLGLKYIANVTYGYTRCARAFGPCAFYLMMTSFFSASFSGRMPAVEIADSIVQTGREILEAVRCYSLCHPNH